MIVLKENKLNKCPCCGNDEFELLNNYFYEDWIEVKWMCTHCGEGFTEVYDLTYKGVTYEVEENNNDD